MQRSLLLCLLGFFVCSQANWAVGDTRISGYGSFVAGKTLSGGQFLADYPKTGIYDEDWSFSPDTSIGIQLSQDIDQRYSFIVQLNAHGAREYETEISWAYVSYQINPELSVQLGRKRLPLYYYSDFFDVGYAYNWIRPPADNYTWQITNYNGINLLYETQFGNWDGSINLYTGREDSIDNDLLSYLSAAEVDERWKNILGLVAEFSHNWINIRATIMSSELDRNINDTLVAENVSQLFTGVSFNLTPGNFSLLSEFNGYKRDDDDIDVHTKMFSMAYTIGELTPYISYSSFKQKLTAGGGDEHHITQSAGVRWDFYRDIALKLQYDDVTDKGVTSAVLGDSKTLSLGVDMVF